MIDKNTFWNSAAKDGLMLGAVSVIYFVVVFLCGKIEAGSFVTILVNIFTTLLWVAKLWISLYLLRYFIHRKHILDGDASDGPSFKYGAAVSMLSALVYSGLYFAFITFVTPDIFEESIGMIAESGMFSKSELTMMNDMAGVMPLYSFIGNFIYCTLFGMVATFFYTRSSSKNPF